MSPFAHRAVSDERLVFELWLKQVLQRMLASDIKTRSAPVL
jgi:hypothetical protein